MTAPEILYLQRTPQGARRLHARSARSRKSNFEAPTLDYFAESLAGSKGRAVSTTMGFVSMLRQLLKDPKIGKLIVPIIPDEGRTFGMESLIRQVGIYASQGQLYKPHDPGHAAVLPRREETARFWKRASPKPGSMASFTAAGTAYANYKVPMIPFFTYYSMFGFQRIGDMVWAFADARGKGFLMGGTAGRTTLAGEGLQHQDGHSLVLAEHRAHLPQLRSRVRVRDRGHRAGRHAAHVSSRAKTASTTSPCTTKTTPCRRCRRARKKAFCAASTSSRLRRRARPRCNCSAAAPS